jgi:hypothetical protein
MVSSHFLGARSFDSQKGPLAHKKTSFPIAFGGIDLIPTINISPTTYLRSWALIVFIIAVKFMVDQHPC